MKLHRLVLTNFRGVTHREIELPDRGVVIVSGANEVGKSSMIEALDLLLGSKDRSARQDVKRVKPTHADVGSGITAEISCGPYRFVYFKRFHKRCETQLEIIAPHREQLTGDEAHERVLAMLGETVDMDLWRAQRILQSAPTPGVDLSGCDALSRALDVAAGQASNDSALSGAEPLLIDRIDVEYRRYFTPTGRPTGEWAEVITRLRAADAQVARCAAAVAEVDDAVRRHATLTEDLERLARDRSTATERLTAAQAAADNVAELTRQLTQAEVVKAAATAVHTASVTALTDRRRLRADIDQRAAAMAEHEPAAAEAADEHDTARAVHEAAEAAAEDARLAVEAGQRGVDSARSIVEQVSDRDEADRLSARLAAVDTSERELAGVQRELAAITLTDVSMRAIETAAAAVDRAAIEAELASAEIELTAAVDVEVRVAGETIALAAGATWSAAAAEATAIELPGLLRARIVPGTTASHAQAVLDAAREALGCALADAGAAEVENARAGNKHRQALLTTRDGLRVTLEVLTGDDDIASMKSRLAELADRLPIDGPADATDARAALDAAITAHRAAILDCETRRKVAAAAAKKLGENATRAEVDREKLATARAELTAARERLAAGRQSTGDDELAVAAQAHSEAAQQAVRQVSALTADLAAVGPEAVTSELDDAVRDADTIGGRYDDAADAMRHVAAELTVYGTQGRKGKLDAAHIEREHAESEFVGVHRRAHAAQLLRTVMARHRDATRQRYVDPFRDQVQRLGRIVFGDTFEVEIDGSLRIVSRTLSGRTVPYESLSGGACEQLGIVARLAAVALVAKEDSVPVLIDDALGFTDPDRLTKMGAVFDAVGGDGQVLVLTCSPARYAGVGGAHHIELTA